MFNMNKPCGVGSNQKVGNLRDLIKPRSTKWIIFPPSTLFLANLSGCHEIIPSALPFSSNDNISANFIRPGSLAVLASQSEATISNFSLAAYSWNSTSCASILKNFLSSSSVDFFSLSMFFFIFFFFFFSLHSNNKRTPETQTKKKTANKEAGTVGVGNLQNLQFPQWC